MKAWITEGARGRQKTSGELSDAPAARQLKPVPELPVAGKDTANTPEQNYREVVDALPLAQGSLIKSQQTSSKNFEQKRELHQLLIDAEDGLAALEVAVEDGNADQAELDTLNTNIKGYKEDIKSLDRKIDERNRQQPAIEKQIKLLSTRKAALESLIFRNHCTPIFKEAMENVFKHLHVAVGAAGLMNDDYLAIDLVKLLDFYAGNNHKPFVKQLELAGKNVLRPMILEKVLSDEN